MANFPMLIDDYVLIHRKRLRDFQRTGMYELGKSAMEYAIDSMNSVGNVLQIL